MKRQNKVEPAKKGELLKLTAELAKKLLEYTPKQAAFFFWYSTLGNATRAALKVSWPDFPENKSYTELTEEETRAYHAAGELGSEYLKKHENPLQLYLDQHGLDFSLLGRKLKEGLEATKTTNAAILLTEKGETIKAEEQGLIEVPNYAERRQWWDRLARILGVSVKEPTTTTATSSAQVNIFNRLKKEDREFVEGEEV